MYGIICVPTRFWFIVIPKYVVLYVNAVMQKSWKLKGFHNPPTIINLLHLIWEAMLFLAHNIILIEMISYGRGNNKYKKWVCNWMEQLSMPSGPLALGSNS